MRAAGARDAIRFRIGFTGKAGRILREAIDFADDFPLA
jgi:hypothetical protein